MPCAQTFNKYYFQSYNRSTTNSCKDYAAFFFNIRLIFGNRHLVIYLKEKYDQSLQGRLAYQYKYLCISLS